MQQPVITIFCAFTRRWAVELWLDNLDSTDIEAANTNICIIIDIDEPVIIKEFKDFTQEHGYRSFHFEINNDHHPNEVRIAARRLRIADVKNQSKDLIAKTDGQYIISFEDDTVFPNLDIMRLLEPIIDNKEIGYVEGVQCGRWGVKMIGAWDFDDFEYPQKAWTLLPSLGYQEIVAGGWYGYATTRELYLNAEYYASSAQPFGPDVNFGLWLRQRGYKCLIDWDTVFGHNDHGKILYPDSSVEQAKFVKNTTTGKWERKDYEDTASN